jgi:hypothetical protein
VIWLFWLFGLLLVARSHALRGNGYSVKGLRRKNRENDDIKHQVDVLFREMELMKTDAVILFSHHALYD